MIHWYGVALLLSHNNPAHRSTMKFSNYNFEVVRAAEDTQNFPEHLSVHRIEGLSKINEKTIQLFVLLNTFLLDLPQTKDHVKGTVRPRNDQIFKYFFLFLMKYQHVEDVVVKLYSCVTYVNRV